MDSRKVCKYWVAGKCNRSPCRFLHSFDDDNELQQGRSKERYVWRRNPNCPNSNSKAKAAALPLPLPLPPSKNSDGNSTDALPFPPDGNCTDATPTPLEHKCEKQLLQFISHDHTFSHVANLQGHQNIVNGIALPSPSLSGSNLLCSGSQDKSVRAWDCATGQCVSVINVEAEVTCMINEGPWIFIGLVGVGVKVWNTHSQTHLILDISPSTRVSSLVLSYDTLYVGTFDGFILSWKFNPVDNHFELAAPRFQAHPLAVVSLAYGANALYSGSMDHSIKVWDVSANSMQCTHTLTAHKSGVLSLLCWHHYLISCSLDKTILIWAMNDESKTIQLHYTHTEEHGVLRLAGMYDEQRSKPVLMCSCTDNTVRLYDLPSLQERGKIFAKGEVRTILPGPHGLFFTGDGAGDLNVWKWSTSS